MVYSYEVWKRYYNKNRQKVIGRCRKYRQDHIEWYKEYDKKRDRHEYKTSPEYRRRGALAVKNRRRHDRIRCLEHYSLGKMVCSCCGENHLEFLSIDHINGGGNRHRKEIGGSGNSLFLWLIKNGFPDGYRVLCYNCNCSLGYYKYCPHSRLISDEAKSKQC